MENVPSPPPLASVSNPDNSVSPETKVDAGGENHVDVKKSSEVVDDDFSELYAARMEKFKTYEEEYTRRLMAKYFSDKNLYGGVIFDEKVQIDEEVIKSSRWPCTRSYADPVKAFIDYSNDSLTTVTDNNQSNVSNGTHPPETNG